MTTGFSVWRSGDRSKFGCHRLHSQIVNKADRGRDRLRTGLLQCVDSMGKFFGVNLSTRLALPLVFIRFQSEEERFETGADHHSRDFRRDETSIQSVRRMEGKTKILPQDGIE